MKTKNESVAKFIYETRKAKNLTQTALSKKMGITQGALSKIENADTFPGLVQYVRFCRAMKIPFERGVKGL